MRALSQNRLWMSSDKSASVSDSVGAASPTSVVRLPEPAVEQRVDPPDAVFEVHRDVVFGQGA
jgi:hypothetical protein